MERYSVKKPQWFSYFFCAKPCLHMLENQGKWTETCSFPQGEATVSSRSHMGVSGETLGSEWKQMLCGFVVSQRLCPPQSTQTVLTCTAWTSPLIYKNYKLKIFLPLLPFCLNFYLKTGQTDVSKLLCLQSVNIPNKGAVWLPEFSSKTTACWTAQLLLAKVLNRSLKIVNFVTLLPYHSPIPEIWCAKATC